MSPVFSNELKKKVNPTVQGKVGATMTPPYLEKSELR